MILAVPYCVTASKRTSCGHNTVLKLRTKTSSALLKAVVTGSGLKIIEFAGRRVVRQLNTIQAHVRRWSGMEQVRVERMEAVMESFSATIVSYQQLHRLCMGGASRKTIAWRFHRPHMYMCTCIYSSGKMDITRNVWFAALEDDIQRV
jgi:hypothetical protein